MYDNIRVGGDLTDSSGADETFTDYGIYLPDVLREPDLTWKDTIPEDERVRLLEKSEADTSAYYKSIGADHITQATTKGRQKLNDIITPASMAAFIPQVFANWTSLLHPRNPQYVIAGDVPASVLEKIQQRWHSASAAQYVWTKDHLANIFLSCLGDRTEMAHSIEGRTPFLDHHLTEYVNTIPPSLRMKWKRDAVNGNVINEAQSQSHQNDNFTAKWILREAMKTFVTKEIYERVKQPYTAPFVYEVGGALHTLFSRLITEENIRKLGFVSWEKASTLLERAFVEKEAAAARMSFCVAQWVVLGKRFGIKTAEPPQTRT